MLVSLSESARSALDRGFIAWTRRAGFNTVRSSGFDAAVLSSMLAVGCAGTQPPSSMEPGTTQREVVAGSTHSPSRSALSPTSPPTAAVAATGSVATVGTAVPGGIDATAPAVAPAEINPATTSSNTSAASNDQSPPPVARSTLPAEPVCPCPESLETYRARARKAASKGNWKAAWQALRAAGSKAEPSADLLAEQAYVAWRNGDVGSALSLNREAFVASSDSELSATILFNEGLVQEQQGKPLAAALAFAWSLEFRDRPATSRRLAKLPDPERRCEASQSTLEICLCDAATQGREVNALHDVSVCRELAQSADGRIVAVAQTLVAPERLINVESVLLLETNASGRRLVRSLAKADNPGTMGMTGSAELNFLRVQEAHGRRISVVRTTTSTFDQNGGGIERFGSQDTFDVLCLLDTPTLTCSDPIQVGATRYSHVEVNTAEDGSPENWTVVEDSSKAVKYGYTIGADGYLIPAKLSGTLELDKPPERIRLW